MIWQKMFNDTNYPTYLRLLAYLLANFAGDEYRFAPGELKSLLNVSKATTYRALDKLKEMNLIDQRSTTIIIALAPGVVVE